MRLIILTLLLLAPFSLFAQEFTPLVGIPGVDPGNADIGTYVQAIYMLAITVAAFLAVVKIIFGGVQYLLSDVVTTKEDAKKDIRGALVGLLIVLTAVLILNTINKDLTKLDLFSLDNALQFRPSGQGIGLSGGGGGAVSPGTTVTTTNCVTADCATERSACESEPGYMIAQEGGGSLSCYTSTWGKYDTVSKIRTCSVLGVETGINNFCGYEEISNTCDGYVLWVSEDSATCKQITTTSAIDLDYIKDTFYPTYGTNGGKTYLELLEENFIKNCQGTHQKTGNILTCNP